MRGSSKITVYTAASVLKVMGKGGLEPVMMVAALAPASSQRARP